MRSPDDLATSEKPTRSRRRIWIVVALVLVAILEVKGLEIAHRTTSGKAIAAILIPGAVCCVCAGLVIAALGAAMFGMINR